MVETGIDRSLQTFTKTLTGVIAGVVWGVALAVTATTAVAGKSDKFLQDFSPALELLREMGLPAASGAHYGNLVNPQNYSRGGQLFYDLEMKGGQWRLPGDRVMTITGVVSEIPKLPGVEWQEVDLAADVATVFKYLENAEAEGYGNLSHQADALAKLIFFAAQLADQGLRDDANRLVAHALAAAENPRDPIGQALQSLAGSAYGEILSKHLASSDWAALAAELEPLCERFGSAWDGGQAVMLLIEKLKNHELKGAAIRVPEGIQLSDQDLSLVKALVESTAAGFEALAKPTAAEGDAEELSEQERMIATMARQPGQLMQAIQSLFFSSPWWSGEELSEDDLGAGEVYNERSAILAAGGAAMMADSLPGMEKWRELAERKFDALPVLLTLATDESFLPVSAVTLRNGGYRGGYDDGMGMAFSSRGSDITVEQQYAQMDRPAQMSELVLTILESMLPGANTQLMGGYEEDPDGQREVMIANGVDWYQRLKDQPEIEITREMFASGGGRQALVLLCRQGNAADFEAIESRLLGEGASSVVDPFGSSGGQTDYESVYLYLKTRGEAGESFYQKVSENAKQQLAGLDKDDWQHDQLKQSMQRIDALYSTETAKDILERVLADDTGEGLMESIGLILETLSKESPDGALMAVLDAMVTHEKGDARLELLQLLSQFTQMEFSGEGGELSPAEKFASQWLVVLNDDREVGADMTNISKTSAWMFLNLHGTEQQIAAAGELWQSLGEGSMDFLRERAVAISEGRAPPQWPDASTVDAARVGELENELLAANGPAMQKVWAGMSYSETLAIREHLKSAGEPPQALIEHLAAQVWQVLEMKLPDEVTALLAAGDSAPAAAWSELKALEGSELNYEKLVALFTKLMPIAAHRKDLVSWQVSMSSDAGSGGVSIDVVALDTDELAGASESDQMLSYLTNRPLENPAAILTVSGEELGGGIWLGAMADADSGTIPDTPESELGGSTLPASYFDNSRGQWLKRIEGLFRPDVTGDPNFEFSLKIVLTSSASIAEVNSEE